MYDGQHWFKPEKPSESVYEDICRIMRDIIDRYKDVLDPSSEMDEEGDLYLVNGLWASDCFHIYVPEPTSLACYWVPRDIPFHVAIREILLVLAAKIPGFLLESFGFMHENSSEEMQMDVSWGEALENVRKRYGIDYDAGYRDEGNRFRFYLNVNGYSVLGTLHYPIVPRFRADAREYANTKLYPEPRADSPPVRRVRRVCSEY
jgi:hypothetical protein